MSKNLKILLIGPFPEPISGVSIANKSVKEILSKNNFKTLKINSSFSEFDENLGVFSFKKLFFYLRLNLNVYKILFVDKVYFTPGQTFFGVAKYSLFILISKLFRKELIIHVHGNYLNSEYEFLSGVKKKIFKFLLSSFHKGIVLSTSLKNNLTEFLRDDKIYTIANFAEDYLYTYETQVKEIETVRFIFLSNLMKEKGIFEFLEAIQLLEKGGFSFEVKIAGNIDKNAEQQLNAIFKNIRSAKYLGVVKGLEKKELLSWGNVFVLPTYYKMEGQPISILEAMATNNVIVTTKHAGIPDIITNKVNGFFVEKKNSNDLKTTLAYLIKNKNVIETIIKTNKSIFLKNYTFKKFEKNILKVFS